MGRHIVCTVGELPQGERKIGIFEGRSVGVFNIKGKYYALKNSCPHQQANLCDGKLMGVMLPSKPGEYVYGRDGEILRCPWHGWEFDITNGKSVFDPFKCLVKTYEVNVMASNEEEWLEVDTYPVEVEGEFVVLTI
jgi:nitrite reductase (NADH) small subunit